MELNIVVIREMLKDLFDDEEFMTFCLDYFPEVRADFSIGMTKTLKIDLLIGYCLEFNLLEKLVSLIEEERPRKFPSYFKKLRDQSPPSSYSNSVKGLVEFETASPVNLSDLTEAQKYWLSTSIKLALANVLQLAPEEVNILNMRSGSIIFSIILPVEVIWLLFNIDKQNNTYFLDAIGLRLTFASGYLEPSEDITSQSVDKSEVIPESEQEAIKDELARRELVKEMHEPKSKIIDAMWTAINYSRKAVLIFYKSRYLYRNIYLPLFKDINHPLEKNFAFLLEITGNYSQLVRLLRSLEVDFLNWEVEIPDTAKYLKSLIANLDASLNAIQRASQTTNEFRWSLNPLSPFFIFGYRKQKRRIIELEKALSDALYASHKAAKLLAIERANYNETSSDHPKV